MSAAEEVQNGGNEFLIDESGVTEIQKYEDDTTRVIREAESWTIRDTQDNVYATKLLGELKIMINSAIEQKDRIIKPWNESKNNYLKQFKEYIDPLKRAREVLGRCMTAYDTKIRREDDERQRLIDVETNRKQEEHRIKVLESADQNITAPPPPVPEIIKQKSTQIKTGSTTVSMVDTLLNENIRILDVLKVPRELCTPNLKLIRKRIESGIREIPGVKWEIVKRPKVRV